MQVYDSDASLLSLPVPALAATGELIKRLVFPHATTAQFNQVLEQAERLKTEGAPLQKALLEWRDSLGGNASWLRPWWDESYCSIRGGLPMEVNYAFQLRPERWDEMPVAKLVLGLCRFFQRVGTGELPPEKVRGSVLSMDALRFMAYTRIPAHTVDALFPIPLTGEATVAVACRGHWFVLTLSDAAGVLARPEQVAAALDQIRAEAASLPAGSPISAMTAADRDFAATIRQSVSASTPNRVNLAALERCWFSLSLEPVQGEAEFFHDCIAGPAGERWFDKSAQIICGAGGKLGMNMEHSGCDAGLWVYALGIIDAELCSPDALPGPEAGGPVTYRHLAWQVDRATDALLAKAESFHRAKAASMQVKALTLPAINRDKVKKLGCAPDAFSQLAFQAAYYTHTRQAASVYESVSVRSFYQGRTEAVRPATEEAIAFACAVQERLPAETLREHIHAAAAAHKERLSLCQRGMGAERHVYGLRCMARMIGFPEPAICTSPGWLAATKDTLSTSSVTGPCIRYFGFGPVVADGLGIGYAMAGDGLRMVVASLPGSGVTASAFLDALDAVIADMISALQ